MLAQQPGGYYVLNDIFRNLADEEEELIQEEAAAPAEAPSFASDAVSETDAVAETESQVDQKEAIEAPVDSPTAAAEIDEELEKAAPNGDVDETSTPTAQTNGTPVSNEPVVPVTPAVPLIPAELEVLPEEKQPEPEPTPIAASPKPAPVAIDKKENSPVARSVPKTWANIASKPTGNSPVAATVVPTQAKSAVPSAVPQTHQHTESQQAVVAPVAPETLSETPVSQPSSSDGSGWQTAGHEHSKRQARSTEEQNTMAYIKNVNEKVDAALLKQTLSRFGKLKYFDVNRPKVCISIIVFPFIQHTYEPD